MRRQTGCRRQETGRLLADPETDGGVGEGADGLSHMQPHGPRTIRFAQVRTGVVMEDPDERLFLPRNRHGGMVRRRAMAD
ncbi:hypothetical protein ACE1SV_61830 [Streptomyces sp. E-15]